MQAKRDSPQKKDIILVLSDDKDDLSEGAYQLIKGKELKNPEIRLFTPECFVGLNQEDIESITIIGHADTASWGNEKGNLSFNPEKFVQTFSTALERANLDKNNIERLRCFGCELGFITKKGSYAQQLANEFAKENYNNLKLSAFTNLNLPVASLVGMRVRIESKGNVTIVGYDNFEKLQEADKLIDKIRAKHVELKNLKAEISCCESVNPFSAAYQGINNLQKEINTLKEQYQNLSTCLYLQTNPINALDTEKRYQFPPSFHQEILKIETEISKVQKIIDGHKDTVHKVNNDAKKIAYLEEKIKQNETKVETLKEKLDSLKDVEERITSPSYSELRPNT